MNNSGIYGTKLTLLQEGIVHNVGPVTRTAKSIFLRVEVGNMQGARIVQQVMD